MYQDQVSKKLKSTRMTGTLSLEETLNTMENNLDLFEPQFSQ